MTEGGYEISALQVENRWKTLERSYKQTLWNNKQTGRSRKTCHYESELSRLLHNKHSLVPLAVSQRSGLVLRKDALETTTLNLESTPLHPSDTGEFQVPNISRAGPINIKIHCQNSKVKFFPVPYQS